MVQTIIRIVSIVLLFVIVSSFWNQRRVKGSNQNNKKKK